MNYEDRLNIPIIGNDNTSFSTNTGLHIATGYTRVVIGGRGPYVEFAMGHLLLGNTHIPEDQKYRLTMPWLERVFYLECRTNDTANVKIYHQFKTVNYADYKVGMFYISPFDLMAFGKMVIV